ncbi:Sir2 family NAD-dependent protein deacetylase [Lentisphaerota bacterium ZTH]|nr:NAD-dependent deacetylase [Lentisphaerota bacterium]WET05113.1 Sir2 family NAD-dependent protein deacetylase [Lentisphaerota bacterium ZTH]
MEQLLDLIKDSEFCTAFTGAGVSTFSGIQDFRGENGIYRNKKIDADKIFSLDYFLKDPSYYYHNSKEFIYNIHTLQPSIVHRTLAAMEARGILKAVITQNIDMLHQRAGTANIVELHGTPAEHYCMNCGNTYSFDEISEIVCKDILPICDICGGTVKPRITFFGEMLPEGALEEAFELARKTDLMIVLGSTLVVQPAASVPALAVRSGAKLVIVNDMPTPLDHMAVLRCKDLEEVCTFLGVQLFAE